MKKLVTKELEAIRDLGLNMDFEYKEYNIEIIFTSLCMSLVGQLQCQADGSSCKSRRFPATFSYETLQTVYRTARGGKLLQSSTEFVHGFLATVYISR